MHLVRYDLLTNSRIGIGNGNGMPLLCYKNWSSVSKVCLYSLTAADSILLFSESILAHGAFPQLSSPDESQDYVSNDSPQYDIRYGHGLAIILFCTVNRPGAKAEADDMDGALSTIGCKVHKHEWKNATEVTDLLEGILNSLTHGYDMLFVCMMSHGHSGMLNGKDESAISINDILFRLTHSMKANQWLQECMPMVRREVLLNYVLA